ncbi:MAG TPA: sigma-70 family RNA polymerase sigma factor [Planctomycetia bacterium]|nr:sigma-70 family RNA polymerase sigma factor [Planctomycetia bacterium]
MANESAADDRWLRDPNVRLMLRVKAGEPGAFETLVARFQDRVVGILRHMTGSPEDAEDLAQNAFLRVFNCRHDYVPRAKFSTWLFTIVHNLALNSIRDGKRRPAARGGDSDSGPLGPRPLEQLALAPSGASPSRILAKAELSELVRAAVAQLSDEQRLAVMLNKFEDMSYRDVAQVLGKSEMAVKSLLSRARTTLKDVLEPYLSGGGSPRFMQEPM